MNNSIVIERLANEWGEGLEVQTPDGFKTKCPCHNDTGLSLLLWEAANGQIRGKCDAGCLNKDIRHLLTAWGLSTIPHRKDVTKSDTAKISNKALRGEKYDVSGYSLTELLSREIEPPTVYLSPFLCAETITLIYAAPGVGKTWVVQSIILYLSLTGCIETKLGLWEILALCGALLVDGEMTEFKLQKRFKALTKDMNLGEMQYPATIFSSMDFVEKYGGVIDLTQEKWRNTITDHYAKHPECKLIVLDNLTSLTTGACENSKKALEPIMHWLLRLRSLGAAIVLVHHAGKDGKDRGHSTIRDNVDNIIALEKNNRSASKVGIIAKFKKGRDLEGDEGEDVKLELLPTASGCLRLVQVDS